MSEQLNLVLSDEYKERLPVDFPELIETLFKSYDLPNASFSESALRILSKRYLIKDSEGNVIETPELLLARVSIAVALRGGQQSGSLLDTIMNAAEYYRMMASLEFLPNSPTLMNAGTSIGNLAACFVVPVKDSMEEIMDAVKSVALIHQSGGGTGMDFSLLRADGSQVKSTQGVASGPVSFMKVFDAATEQIKQGGKRRGANMGVLRVDHPDIEKFIACKDDGVSLQNFNISVAVTDKFMRALEGEGLSITKVGSGVYEPYGYEVIDSSSGLPVDVKDARDVWSMVVEHAHKTGDPGVIFIDTINKKSPFDLSRYPEHTVHATNPCGEQPLEDYEACNLGSINVAAFVVPDKDGKRKVDLPRLRKTVALCVRFLDDVIDAAHYPLPQIEKKVKQNRKIGLGVMGLADLLIALKVPYNSSRGRNIASELMKAINDQARATSSTLAEERGDFPSHPESNFKMPMRNATVTTIAPTGTIGMLADVSSGIEPLFALRYKKTVMDGTEFDYVNPNVHGVMMMPNEHKYLDDTGRLHPHCLEEQAPWLVTSHDIDPKDHVLMQAVIQGYVDNAVSKTINLPHDATLKDIDDVYRLAYAVGCKGITVYRDGSKQGQVLTTSEKPADDLDKEVLKKMLENNRIVISRDSFEEFSNMLEEPESYEIVSKDDYDALVKAATPEPEPEPKPRPECVWGPTARVDTPCGGLYVTITEDEDGIPMEIFARLGKGGGCAAAVMESTGRLASHMLRSGHSPETVIKQLKDVSCGQRVGLGPNSVRSCQDAIALVLQRYVDGSYHNLLARETSDEENEEILQVLPDGPGAKKKVRTYMNGACPECGGPIEHEGGCAACHSCGYSKCS